jgi:rhodanese-related sulfurtransferase
METIIIVGAVVLFMIWRLKPVKGITHISVEQLKDMLSDKNKAFVDVRTPAEYKARNISAFMNIPLGSDFSKLPQDKEIVVICQSGMRSSQACKQLKKLGYTKISNVRGGMNAWRG